MSNNQTRRDRKKQLKIYWFNALSFILYASSLSLVSEDLGLSGIYSNLLFTIMVFVGFIIYMIGLFKSTILWEKKVGVGLKVHTFASASPTSYQGRSITLSLLPRKVN